MNNNVKLKIISASKINVFIAKQDGKMDNNKILILSVVVLIISITPVSAFNIQGFQNEGNNVEQYLNHGFWYKLGHLNDFYNSISNLGKYASEATMELNSIYKNANDKKLLANKNERELNKRYNERKEILEHLADKKLENEYANTCTVQANGNDAVKLNTVGYVGVVSDKNGNISSNSKTNLITNINKTGNKTVNKTDSISIHNHTIEVLDRDAKETKQKLEESGAFVNIGNIENNQLKNNTIVQLVNREGYIKYWLYTGTVTKNYQKFEELYNGEDFVLIPPRNFRNSFSGIILQVLGTEDNFTLTEIVKEVYDIKLKDLQDNINTDKDLLIDANYLKCIGIGLSMLIPIISILMVLLTLTPEPLISKLTAILLGALAILFWSCAAFVYSKGVYLEGTSIACMNDFINEKEDLTSHNM